jgi:hypothetical protein
MEENQKPQYSLFEGKVQFDSPDELKQYIKNGDGPVIGQFLVSILEVANKNGSFNIAESVIMSEVLERAVGLLSLIKTKKNEEQ